MKLHPSVCWSHPASQACPPPPPSQLMHVNMHAHANVDSQLLKPEPGVLMFDRSFGTYDWNYPWDMCGSVYRRRDVATMFRAIGSVARRKELKGGDGDADVTELTCRRGFNSVNPNTLESYGHEVARLATAKEYSMSTSPSDLGVMK